MLSPDDDAWKEPLMRSIECEAVAHLDDLLLRRSALGDNPERALALAPEVCRMFHWNEERQRAEIDRLKIGLFAFGQGSIEPDAA